MDQQKTPTFSEDISTIVSQLPVPVQEFFASGKSEIIAMNIMQKYKLHIDQGTILEREIIMLLLGLKNPDEFTQALLKEARLDQKTIDSIVQDINTQIFMPLREEMRKGVEAFGGKPPQIPSVMPARQPTTAPVMPRPSPLLRQGYVGHSNVTQGTARPMSVPPAPAAGVGQPASHFHLENKLPPRPSAQVPVAAAALRTPVPALSQQSPKPIPVQPSVTAQTAPFPQPPRPSPKAMEGTARPMSAEPIPPRPLQSVTPITKADASVGSPTVFASGPKSVNILSIAPLPPKFVSPRPMNVPPRPVAETPLQQALRTVLPPSPVVSDKMQAVSPPPNLPGAMPPLPVVSDKVQDVSSPTPSTEPYSADPYREPIE